MAAHTQPAFADLLRKAVEEPGIISSAYSQFHSYSLGNQLLAWSQCLVRGLRPGPLATFPRWKELGRHVRRGEKALTLCMPVTCKRVERSDDGTEQELTLTRFVYRPLWFVLTQTEGQELAPTLPPTWEKARALPALAVEEVLFDLLDGNCLGFARGRSVAVSPVNPLPHKTLFHELAHVLLGHTAEADQNEIAVTPRNLREAEAECVALLCCEALALPGAAECRGYVQAWWGHGNPIPERSAQRVLRVADDILRAGRRNEAEGGGS
jgi:antirestriction protein ArdC